MSKYLTVVYTINDEAAFKSELDAVMNKFKSSKGEPFSITAVSRDHEIQRVEWIETALANNDIDAALAAISKNGIGGVLSLAELSE